MEEYAARIELEPEPQSAPGARRWVREVLEELGRPDLTESAAAGVSELVTNGILHAHTSISLVLQAFAERVVISVTDRSPVPNQTGLDPTTIRDEESTVGRGLHIVRACADDWGVASSRHGKVIWFVPATDPATVEVAFPALELLGDEESSEPPVAGPLVRVEMRDAPVFLLRHFHERWSELLREMHLIALGEPSTLQGLAEELIDLVPLTRAARWMTPESTADFAEAVSTGRERLDLVLDVPRDAASAFSKVLEISRALDEVRHEDLLFVGAGEQGNQLRDWWFGEIARQVREGASPRPWAGSYDVDSARQRS